MVRLDDIPKKEFFKAPDGYFDGLPSRIQSRIVEKPRTGPVVAKFAFRYALPVVLVAAGWLFYRTGHPDAEAILASVETEELIGYLQDTGMTTEEMLEDIELTPEEVDALENEVYDLTFEDMEIN